MFRHPLVQSDTYLQIKVGDRVGCGAQVWSCLKCKQCKSDNENYCPHQVGQFAIMDNALIFPTDFDSYLRLAIPKVRRP